MGSVESSMGWKILYGENNSETAAAQSVFFQKAGHQTETAIGRKAVEEALRKGSYDLVVLGPTLTRNDRHHLPYIVKKTNIRTKVLVMHTDGERHPYVDANTDTGRSIADVVAKIASMAGTSVAAEKRMAAGAGAEK
jgi:DNA-binding NtrC family response regulator